MIVGNGLLARAFTPHFAGDQQVTVFASGVSNSSEIRPAQFERERELLQASLDSKRRTIYFSTCSVHDSELAQSPYVQHKLEMEALVSRAARANCIFRLPQVVGQSDNPHTLTNYLYHQISTGARFQVWLNARRNLIDISDAVAIITDLVSSHQADGSIMNIACPFSVPVPELVRIFETVLNKKANFESVAAGADYTIDVRQAQLTAARLGIEFGANYVDNLIRKYYA
jgi:nucleoside-diphosphate-sugar epimerase